MNTWTMEECLEDLRAALAFFDKVRSVPRDVQTAIGTDHWDWLEKAARRVAAKSTAG